MEIAAKYSGTSNYAKSRSRFCKIFKIRTSTQQRCTRWEIGTIEVSIDQITIMVDDILILHVSPSNLRDTIAKFAD